MRAEEGETQKGERGRETEEESVSQDTSAVSSSKFFTSPRKLLPQAYAI